MSTLSLANIRQLSGWRKLWLFITLLFVATLFFPVYALAHSTAATTIFGMHSLPLATTTTVLFVAATLAALVPARRFFWLSSCLVLVGVVTANIVNSQGSDAVTPQPFTAITLFAYFAIAPLGLLGTAYIILLKRLAARARAKGKPSFKEGIQKGKEQHRAKKAARAAAAEMKSQKQLKQIAQEVKQPHEVDFTRGAIYALGGPIIGAAIWLGLWEVGFIASIAAYAMVALTLSFYRKGAHSVVIDKRALYLIVGYTVFGLLLAFFASFTSDSVKYLLSHDLKGKGVSVMSVLTDHNFWSWNFRMLTDMAVLKSYTWNFVFAIILSGLGLYSTFTKVLLPSHQATKAAQAQVAKPKGTKE